MKPNVVVSALLFLALACTLPSEVCGCPPALGIGTLAGIVTRTNGAAVPDAEVRVEARLDGCTASQANALVDPPVTRTDAAGRYRYEMRAWSPSDTACLRVVARRTGAAEADSAVVAGVRMRLVPSYGTRSRPDSLRIDLQLR